MARAVVVGPQRWASAFEGSGFESVRVEEPEGLMQALLTLSRDTDLSIVLVNEALAEGAMDAVEEFRKRSRVVLCIIPSHEGSKHIGFAATRRLAASSLGVDLLGDE
jgi:vacuolar-type H+-ATPase subunit F/Vma7